MNGWMRSLCALLVGWLVPAGHCPAAPVPRPGPDAGEIRKITAAAPGTPFVRPAKPRKMLVFSVGNGGRRAAIPFGAKALEILGHKSGAFEAILSGDPAHFEPDRIKKFDVICFLNASAKLSAPEDLARDASRKKGLLAWVRAGGGVVGIHEAIDAFGTWDQFHKLIGAAGDGRPWFQTVTLKNDGPDHPVNAAFRGKGCRIKDRIYQLKAPYSRGALRVLMSLDVAHTRMDRTDPRAGAKPVHRTDDDFAVSWVRTWGRGRVFYCALGGRKETFWNPMILRHYLAGIQYAAGDLRADATPSAQRFEGSHPPEDAAGFRPLLNGKDTAGWTCKPGSWVFEKGALSRKGGGDIWTEKTYGDFVLDLEFKLARGTNSGVLIRTGDVRNWVQTGIEVQLYDSYAKATPSSHDCGAVFDCLAPAVNAVHAPGRWNRMTITARAHKIAIVLNRKRIIDMDLDRWPEAGKNPDGTANKFTTAYKHMPRRGRIGLQDHGHAVWFRNVRIKTLRGG